MTIINWLYLKSLQPRKIAQRLGRLKALAFGLFLVPLVAWLKLLMLKMAVEVNLLITLLVLFWAGSGLDTNWIRGEVSCGSAEVDAYPADETEGSWFQEVQGDFFGLASSSWPTSAFRPFVTSKATSIKFMLTVFWIKTSWKIRDDNLRLKSHSLWLVQCANISWLGNFGRIRRRTRIN